MLRKTLVALIVVVGCSFATAAFADGYAAIAYSRTTGRYGYTYNYSDLGDAETDAVARCKAGDALIVAWSRNQWCALAVSDDGSYGYSSGWTQAEAQNDALSHCTGNAHILAAVYSGTD